MIMDKTEPMNHFKFPFRTFFFIILLSMFAAIGCTSNPFGFDETIASTKIKGKIVLEDNIRPDSIYVWLETFDIGDYTDSQGNFSLKIPPPNVQGIDNGLSGKFMIYFYLPNYFLDSVAVWFANGKLADDQETIDSKGKLTQTVVLEKILNIKNSVVPSVITIGYADTVKVYSELESLAGELTVKCLIYNVPFGASTKTYKSGLILQSVTSNKMYRLRHEDAFKYPYTLPFPGKVTWTYNLLVDSTLIEPGTYRIVPFIIIPQAKAPAKLIENITIDFPVYEFETNCFSRHIKCTDAFLQILPKEE